MLRTVARVPLTPGEAAILETRAAGRPVSAWVADLARVDVTDGAAPVRPPPLSRAAAASFVSVSLPPALTAAISTRRGELPLTDCLRGLLHKEAARLGGSMPLPRPGARPRSAAPSAPTARADPARRGGSVVELPHGDRSFAELEALHHELAAAGYDADPSLLAVRRFDADGEMPLQIRGPAL